MIGSAHGEMVMEMMENVHTQHIEECPGCSGVICAENILNYWVNKWHFICFLSDLWPQFSLYFSTDFYVVFMFFLKKGDFTAGMGHSPWPEGGVQSGVQLFNLMKAFFQREHSLNEKLCPNFRPVCVRAYLTWRPVCRPVSCHLSLSLSYQRQTWPLGAPSHVSSGHSLPNEEQRSDGVLCFVS